MAARSWYSLADRQAVVALALEAVANGGSQSRAALDLGITPQTLYAWIAELAPNAAPRRQGGARREVDRTKVARAVALYQAGATIEEASREVGIAPDTFTKRARDWHPDFKFRPKPERRTARERRADAAAQEYETALCSLFAKRLDLDASRVVVRCEVTLDGSDIEVDTEVTIDGAPPEGQHLAFVTDYLRHAFERS